MSGKLLWGDREQNKLKVLSKRTCMLGPFSVLCCLVQGVNSVPHQGLSKICYGLVFEVSGKTLWTKIHDKECEKLQLPYYQAEGTLRSRVILNTLGRRALSFPWASLTPQQSQFTLLDFQSMESLMLGEIGFLARDKLPGRQRALAMAVFSPLSKPQLFQRPPHPMDKSHRAKIQPLLLISDQEWANSLAQGGYRKRAKLQKTGRAMTQLLCAQFSIGACSWSLWGRQRSQKHFSNKVRTVFSAWGTQGFHPLASLVSSCAWALQAQAL